MSTDRQTNLSRSSKTEWKILLKIDIKLTVHKLSLQFHIVLFDWLSGLMFNTDWSFEWYDSFSNIFFDIAIPMTERLEPPWEQAVTELGWATFDSQNAGWIGTQISRLQMGVFLWLQWAAQTVTSPVSLSFCRQLVFLWF